MKNIIKFHIEAYIHQWDDPARITETIKAIKKNPSLLYANYNLKCFPTDVIIQCANDVVAEIEKIDEGKLNE
jgi:hypothetical protein